MKSTNRKNSNSFGYTINLNDDMSETVRTRILNLVDREEGVWMGTMTELRSAIGYGRSKTLTNPRDRKSVV